MTIFSRFTRLVRADVHELLDSVEEPRAVLKQAVRDMEEALGRGSAEIAQSECLQQQLSTALSEEERAAAKFQEQVDFALSAGEESLARSFLRKRLESEKRRDELSQTCAKTDRHLRELKKVFAEREEQLRSVKEKMAVLEAVPPSQDSPIRAPSSAVSEEEVEIAMLREKARRTGAQEVRS